MFWSFEVFWSFVAHVRRKVPIGYNGAPQICPQKHPFPWTDPKTPINAPSLDPSDLWRQTAPGSDPPFFHNALDRPTDRRTDAPTHRPTDRPRESLTTIGRCAKTATRPNIDNNDHTADCTMSCRKIADRVIWSGRPDEWNTYAARLSNLCVYILICFIT